jgi:hypothetical protein
VAPADGAPGGPPGRAPAAVVVAAAALLAASAGRAEGIAMLPLEGPGLLPTAREQLDADVRGALARHPAAQALQALADTSALIAEAETTGLDCLLNDEGCAVRAGLVTEVARVVVARVEKVQGRLVLAAALLDVGGSPARRAVAEVPVGEARAAALDAVVGHLFGAPAPPTQLPLRLAVVPADAAVVIDDRSGARTTDGVAWLAPGTHTVRASAPGFVPLQTTVAVADDVIPPPVTLALQPEPPVVLRPAFLGGVALGLVGVGVGVGATVWASQLDAALAEPQPLETRNGTQLGVLALGGLVVPACIAAAVTGTWIAMEEAL